MGQNVGAGMAGVGRSSDSRLYALWDAVDPNCHSGDFEQTWLDLSGNDRTVTRTTQPSTTAGFNGTAIPQFTREGLLFSNAQDCCFTLNSRVSDSSFYNDGMTVLATIKTTNSASSPNYGGDAAATILGDTSGSVIWSFGIEAGKIKWSVYNGSWYSYVSFGTVNDNKWHQIAVTREPGRPSELKFYIDGELDRVEGASTSYTSIAFNAIGRGYSHVDRYTGYLRNLAVWNKVLTGSEIREIYNAQGGFDPEGKGPHISAGLNGTAEDPRPSKGARFFLGFKYRQIINYAYTAGGYKNSVPWKSVHKTVASTDQTSNLGDQLTYAANYTSGGCNYRLLFMWAASNSHPGSSTSTVTMNMFTDTLFTPTTAMNMQTTRNDCGTVFKEHDFAWICGGGSTAVDKFNYTNETMASSALSGGINNSAAHGALSGFSDQHYGYWYHQSAGQKITFATDTFSSSTTWGSTTTNGGQQKGICSKLRYAYCGNEGGYNGGYNLRRWYLVTDTNLGTFAKPQPNCGEENFTMGQDHQYMLGNYDGAQNNENWKIVYATDTGTANVNGLSPTAHAGQSSGHCGWRE